MIHSFLLIGQSNMAGRGYLDEAPEIDTSRIKILRNGRWQEMFRPINPDRSFSGTSLAESFAECYAKKYNVDVGLICCADGGTSLDQWKVGDVLFDNAVSQAKLAMRSSALVGVLWHQGESDCREELYTTYEKRFVVLMDALRRELDIEDVPFLVGGLGDFLKDCALDDNLKTYPHVNEALKSIAQNNKMTGFVSAQGLLPNPDNLHFNAQALYEFGIRYFDEYEKLVKKDRYISEIGDKDSVRTAMEKL